jgi:hypothetical protein
MVVGGIGDGMTQGVYPVIGDRVELDFQGTARVDVNQMIVVKIPMVGNEEVPVVGFKISGNQIVIQSYQPKLIAQMVSSPSEEQTAIKIRKPRKTMLKPDHLIGEAQRWTATTGVGDRITYNDCLFTQLPPIISLTVAGETFNGADYYFFVRDCVAAPGCQGSVTAVEAGGQWGDTFSGFRWTHLGEKTEVYYFGNDFPYDKSDLVMGVHHA